MSRQFLDAMKIARSEGKVEAIREMHQKIIELKVWADAKSSDDAYYQGMRDGIVKVMEGIGLDRWQNHKDTKSGK